MFFTSGNDDIKTIIVIITKISFENKGGKSREKTINEASKEEINGLNI